MKLKTLILALVIAVPALAAGANALLPSTCGCGDCACGGACDC
jgi:hypothetical protein